MILKKVGGKNAKQCNEKVREYTDGGNAPIPDMIQK